MRRETSRPDEPPVGRLGWVQIDCHDPERLAAFWEVVLGVRIDGRLGDPPRYVNLAPAAVGSPRVCFQRVPERKAVKNRLHFDLAVDQIDRATTRIQELGGRRVPHDDYHEHGYSWRLMEDPEGNEFCLIYNWG